MPRNARPREITSSVVTIFASSRVAVRHARDQGAEFTALVRAAMAPSSV